MGLRKLKNSTPATRVDGLADNESMLKVPGDDDICCGDEGTMQTLTNSAANITSAGEEINRAEIDGIVYTFDALADTQAEVIDELYKAFYKAGYYEESGEGVSITSSGAETASVFSVKTTSTSVKLIGDEDTEIALTAS